MHCILCVNRQTEQLFIVISIYIFASLSSIIFSVFVSTVLIIVRRGSQKGVNCQNNKYRKEKLLYIFFLLTYLIITMMIKVFTIFTVCDVLFEWALNQWEIFILYVLWTHMISITSLHPYSLWSSYSWFYNLEDFFPSQKIH